MKSLFVSDRGTRKETDRQEKGWGGGAGGGGGLFYFADEHHEDLSTLATSDAIQTWTED